MKKMKMVKKEIKRILVVRLAMIGDVLLTTPFLKNLRRNFPKAHITYIVGRLAAPILFNNPHIDELIISDRTILNKLAKQHKYDLAFDLMGVDITAQLCLISGAQDRIGVYGRESPCYNYVLGKAKKGMNVMDYFMSLFKELGLESGPSQATEIFLTRKEQKVAAGKLRGFKNRVVGIQPACNLEGRLWPEKKFARLADVLVEKYNYSVVILQGPGEEEIAQRMKNYMQQSATVLPVMMLRQYLAVLRRCNLFIANEDGPLHMAIALKVPTIGIFGPSYHQYWFYYKNNFRKIVAKNISDISVERVIQAFNRRFNLR